MLIHRYRNRAVVVPSLNRNANAWTDTFFIEELQQPTVALIDARDPVSSPDRGLCQQARPPYGAPPRCVVPTVSVRTGVLVTQFLNQLFFECRGYGVFESLGFVMHLVPRHAENLGQHPLNQVVTNDGPFRDLSSLSCQLNVAVALDGNQTVLAQALQRKCHRGPGHRKPVCESRSDDGFTLSFRFRNCLKVILLETVIIVMKRSGEWLQSNIPA